MELTKWVKTFKETDNINELEKRLTDMTHNTVIKQKKWEKIRDFSTFQHQKQCISAYNNKDIHINGKTHKISSKWKVFNI